MLTPSKLSFLLVHCPMIEKSVGGLLILRFSRAKQSKTTSGVRVSWVRKRTWSAKFTTNRPGINPLSSHVKRLSKVPTDPLWWLTALLESTVRSPTHWGKMSVAPTMDGQVSLTSGCLFTHHVLRHGVARLESLRSRNWMIRLTTWLRKKKSLTQLLQCPDLVLVCRVSMSAASTSSETSVASKQSWTYFKLQKMRTSILQRWAALLKLSLCPTLSITRSS